MAAPTDVRVEAQSITSAILRWTYPGAASIAVFRSTDGVSYAEITTLATRVMAGTVSYTDTTLATGTKYWYKLSDDAGATFSSVVTVWSHSCLSASGSLDALSLPRFDGSEQQSAELNNLAERIESTLGSRVLAPEQCIACPADGRVIIDCSNGCQDWVVIADQDINSISVQWCNEAPGTVEFLIPPNTTNRRIGGWPAGLGFTGDEGFRAPITTDPFGMSMGTGIGGSGGGGGSGKTNPTSRRGYNAGARTGGGSRGTGAGGGCNCVPGTSGQLTIKSCNDNNSLDCSSTKTLELLVCGGKGPYTWSVSGDIRFKEVTDAGHPDGLHTSVEGTSATVVPPANTGTGVAGTAYVKYGGECQTNTGVPTPCTAFQFATFAQSFGCNDQSLGACGSVFTELCPCAGNCAAVAVNLGAGSCSSITACADGGTCSSGTCDARTAGMIAANCNPCGSQGGSTVSVTDAAGVTVTIVLNG